LTTSRSAIFTSPRPPPTRPPPPQGAYFPALDGIRAVAFLMVFATHYLQLPWGWTGVNVFFVLSGFLITGILYDTRGEPNRISTFYLRRALRILPLYYGLILVLVLLYPIFRWQWSWDWLIWPAYLGNMARAFHSAHADPNFALLEFAQPLSRTFPRIQLAFGHFWSLCVEEQFYLVWPLVVFGIGDRRKLIRLCAAGLIVLPLLRILANHTLSPAALDNAVLITATPLPFDALLLGAIVALLRRGPWAATLLPAARIGFAALSATFLLWLALNPAARHIVPPYPYPSGTFTWGLTLIDALSACLIVMAIEYGSLAFRLFNLRPLRWLGRISYGAYVFHDILHNQIARLFQHYTAHWVLPTAALAFAFTLLLSWASFRWFESPFLRLKHHWTLHSAPAEQTPQLSTPELIHHVA
jgi:peptidoglycan/LPS O-acetylase OafA/YrhL